MSRATMKFWLWVMLIQLAPRLLNAAPAEGIIPPPTMPNMNHIPSKLTAPATSKVLLGKLIVELELTTLGEVQKSAGVGAIQHMGDAGGSEDWLCYTTSLRGQSERIWISSGELGGSEHAVDSFYAVANTNSKESAHCPELPARLRPVSLGSPIWLGSSPHQLNALYGEPSMKSSGWWFYSYSGKVPVNGFDRLAILGAHVINGKIVGLFVSQATTN